MALTPMDTNQFHEAVNSGQVVLAYFWTDWEESSTKTLPVIEKLAEQFDGQAVIGSINADSEGFLALDLYVSLLPTVIIYEEGMERDRIPGPRSLEDYAKALDFFVNPEEPDPFELIQSMGYIE